MASQVEVPDEQQSITNDGDERKYFHMIINMAEDDLDPFEYRLLGHYIRIGRPGTSFFEGLRQTAEACKMSVNKVIAAQNALVQKKYIRIRKPTKEQQKMGMATEIAVMDRWAENILRYSQPVLNMTQGGVSDLTRVKRKPVLNMTQEGVSDLTHPVSDFNTIKNYSENGGEKTGEEQKDISSPFGVNFMFNFLGHVLTAAVDAIEQAQNQPQTPFEEFVNQHVSFDSKKNPIQEAVAWAFKVKPGGFAGTLGSQLSGTATKGKRAEWNIEPGLDPLEIVAFGIWYNAMYEDKPPTTAETLYERALQFRDSYEYPEALNRAKGVLAQLMGYSEVNAPEEELASAEALAAFETELQELYGG